MAPAKLESILQNLDAEHLKRVILRLSANLPSEDRSTVSLPAIIDALTEGQGLGPGREGWQAQLRLREAIIKLVEEIPGMLFVEGDA
ncbi:MAG: hypothetical protein J7M05_09555 [Anaerolineae bacterium]|nr:hypothetical protein [Anaerolineae bacterium]